MSPAEFDVFLRRLFSLEVPKVIIFLVLLVWWLDISPDSGIQFLDFFAGKARLALMAEGAGFRVQAFDKSYGDKRASRKGKRSSMDLNSNAGMVIAISLILRSKMDQLVAAFGVVCSSFVPINRGTSKRCYLCPHGDESAVAVRRGNKLMARSTILMYLVVAAGGHYVLENPQGSLIALHERYVQFLRTLLGFGITTYKVSMWMRKFQSFTWKRTWLWSSSDLIYRLDLGPLTDEEKQGSEKTVTRTFKNGKECWTANDNLKPTQEYTFCYARHFAQLLPEMYAKGPMEFSVSEKPLIQLWNAKDFEWSDLWSDCDLMDVVRYCRGSRKLKIPNEWKPHLPSHL